MSTGAGSGRLHVARHLCQHSGGTCPAQEAATISPALPCWAPVAPAQPCPALPCPACPALPCPASRLFVPACRVEEVDASVVSGGAAPDDDSQAGRREAVGNSHEVEHIFPRLAHADPAPAWQGKRGGWAEVEGAWLQARRGPCCCSELCATDRLVVSRLLGRRCSHRLAGWQAGAPNQHSAPGAPQSEGQRGSCRAVGAAAAAATTLHVLLCPTAVAAAVWAWRHARLTRVWEVGARRCTPKRRPSRPQSTRCAASVSSRRLRSHHWNCLGRLWR